MNVFKVRPDYDDHRHVFPGSGKEKWMETGRKLLGFSCEAATWDPPMFFWGEREKPVGDFFGIGDPSLLGITYNVKRCGFVWDMLTASGEFLPIQIEDYGEALILHVTKSRIAINYERSRTQKFQNGKIMVIQPVLNADGLLPNELLRLPDMPTSVLMTESGTGACFRTEYARYNLTGLCFEMLEVIGKEANGA
jgi:hypothetical protein